MFKKMSLIFVLAMLLSGFFVKPVEARAVPVRVFADAEWVDSGIYVYDGDTYNLKANGKAITGPLNEYPGAISGSGGQLENICDNGNAEGYICALDGEPFGALIGKIGEGESFLIGDASFLEFEGEGILYLAVNDYLGTYFDNHAGFTVIFK